MIHPLYLPSNQSNSILVAIAVGAAYLLVLYALARYGGYEYAADTKPEIALYTLWIAGGHFLLAAFPIYLLVRYGYLVPTLAFLGLAGYAVSAELGGTADSPLAIYGMFWLVPMAVILAVAGLEYGVRTTASP